MICDELSNDEILEAFLLYASLHGMSTDEQQVRERISNYCDRNQPDATIDDALLAYLEDRIVAPPDIVVQRWGSSRFYELIDVPDGWRHQTCEAWFDNGCRFPDQDAPKIVHFWTQILADSDHDDSDAEKRVTLREGMRVEFDLKENLVQVSHRVYGRVGRLPDPLVAQLQHEPLLSRKYLALVDFQTEQSGSANETTSRDQAASRDASVDRDEHSEHRELAQRSDSAFQAEMTRDKGTVSDATDAVGAVHSVSTAPLLLVTCGTPQSPVSDLVSYAARAFHARRSKC